MKHSRKIIYLVGFLFSIPLALTSYINSSLLEGFTNAFAVSSIYIVASVLTIIGMFRMESMLSRFGNSKTTIFFCFLTLLSLLELGFGRSPELVVLAFIVYFVSTNLIIISLDIFIEDFSKNQSVGGIRGIYLAIINSAWVLAQLISGSIIARSSFRGIYLLSALFMVLMSLVLFLFLKNFQDPKYKKIAIWKTILFFVRSKNMLKIYFINLILKFFFAWMIIYTPIYLFQYLGFGWNKIGIIFTIMLLPFVFLELPLGRLSDKIGEKEILFTGFCISAIATFVMPFITVPSVMLWAFILFCTRVGASAIEVMSETYFFKKVGEEHEDELSFFRNTTPISFIIAPILGIMVLALAPSFKFIFFILAIILLLGALLSLRIKDTK